MKIKNFSAIHHFLLVVSCFTIFTSFSGLPANKNRVYADKLKMDIMVVNRAKLESLFSTYDHILFQTVNRSADEETGNKRHRYKLVAYRPDTVGGGYTQIPFGDIFEAHGKGPRIIQKDNNSPTDGIFGNIILRRSHLPNPGPGNTFRFVVLDPRRSQSEGDEYVGYLVYYAEKKNDIPNVPPKAALKGIIITSLELNPSPPAM